MPARVPPISPIVAAIQAEVRRQGLSTYKVAKLAGLRVYTVQRIMGNTGGATLATIEAVAKALNMRLEIRRQ